MTLKHVQKCKCTFDLTTSMGTITAYLEARLGLCDINVGDVFRKACKWSWNMFNTCLNSGKTASKGVSDDIKKFETTSLCSGTCIFEHDALGHGTICDHFLLKWLHNMLSIIQDLSSFKFLLRNLQALCCTTSWQSTCLNMSQGLWVRSKHVYSCLKIMSQAIHVEDPKQCLCDAVPTCFQTCLKVTW